MVLLANFSSSIHSVGEQNIVVPLLGNYGASDNPVTVGHVTFVEVSSISLVADNCRRGPFSFVFAFRAARVYKLSYMNLFPTLEKNVSF